MIRIESLIMIMILAALSLQVAAGLSAASPGRVRVTAGYYGLLESESAAQVDRACGVTARARRPRLVE